MRPVQLSKNQRLQKPLPVPTKLKGLLSGGYFQFGNDYFLKKIVSKIISKWSLEFQNTTCKLDFQQKINTHQLQVVIPCKEDVGNLWPNMSNRPHEKGLNLQAFEDKSEYGSFKALTNYSNTLCCLHVCSTTNTSTTQLN